MQSDFYPAHSALGDTYLQMGRVEEAITELQTAGALGGNRITKTALGYAYAVSGQKDKAQAALNELREMSKGKSNPAFYLATIYTGLGQKDQAFQQLEKAYEERFYRLIFLGVDPIFDSLHRDPRFQELLRRVRLSPAPGG
jgi:tetratricopeptide (TPR) repeat protein